MTRLITIGVSLTGLTLLFVSPSDSPPVSMGPSFTLTALWLVTVLILGLGWNSFRRASRCLFWLTAAAAPIVAAAIFIFAVNRVRPSATVIAILLCWAGLQATAAASGDRASQQPTVRPLTWTAVMPALSAAALVVFTPTAASAFRWHEWLAHQPREFLGRSPHAPVSVVVFTDYQCPVCKARHYEFDKVLDELATLRPGTVSLQRFDFPLQAECNPAVPGTLHPAACEAAILMKIADADGRSREAMERIYAEQVTLTPDRVKSIAREMGLPFERMHDAALVAVRQEAKLGGELRVTGTPTYFVNGIRVRGWDVEAFRSVVLSEMARAN